MSNIIYVVLGFVTLLWSLLIILWVVKEQRQGSGSVSIAILWLLAAATLLPVAADLQFRRGITLETNQTIVLIGQGLLSVLVLVSSIAIATKLRARLNPAFGLLSALWGILAISSLLNGQTATSAGILGLVALALGLSSVDGATLLFHGRVILRIYVVTSLGALFFAPASAWLSAGERHLMGLPQFIGIASHPNAVGPIAALAVVLEAFGRSGPRYRWLFGSMATIIVVIAQSRSGWLIAAVGLASLLIINEKTGRVRKFAVWVVGALLLSGVIFVLTTELANLNVLSSGRLHGWQVMLSLIPETWFMGGGIQVLSNAFGNGKLMDLGSWSAQAHNQFFQTFLDSGIFGLFVLLALFMSMIKQVFHGKGPLFSLKIASIGMLLVFAITETPLRPSLGEISIFGIICLLMVCSTDVRKKAPLVKAEANSGNPSRSPSMVDY